jgi:hypothetical protein
MSHLQKIVVSAPMAVGQLKVQLGKMDKKYTSQYIHISNRIMIFSTRAADYISLIPQTEENGVQGYKTSNSGSNSRFTLYLGETREHG